MTTKQALETSLEALWQHAVDDMRRTVPGFVGIIGKNACVREEYLPGRFVCRDVPVWQADIRLFRRFDPSI